MGFVFGVFVLLMVGFVVCMLLLWLILFGIVVYVMNFEMLLNLLVMFEGWYSEYLSWCWLFW